LPLLKLQPSYFFIELPRLYWICATFKTLRYGFTGTRFGVW